MLSFFTEWHGWDSTCIKCGRNWQDGEWIPLDFARGIRAEMVTKAKQRFRSTKQG